MSQQLEAGFGPLNIIPHNAALIIIDVQQAIDYPKWKRWGPRNNPPADVIPSGVAP